MKKYVVLFAAVLLLGGGAAGWWLVSRRDPLAQAHSFLAQGDVDAATVALRAAVRNDPENADARAQLAELQLRAGDGVAGEREARAALQLRPGDGRIALVLAEAYAAQGKWKNLLSEFPADKASADTRARLLVLRSSADLATNDVPAAEAEAKAAEAAAPNTADPPVLLARIALARKDVDGAQAELDRALAADGKRVDALMLKGRLLQQAGNLAGALQFFDRAAAAAPNNSGVFVERALLLIATNQDAKARADVNAAMKANGRDLVPVYLDAVLLTRAGKYAEADPQYGKVNTVITRLPRGYFFLALNKLGLGQTEQALDAASRFNSREPGDLPGIKLLAQAQIAARQPGLAVTLLNNAVKNGQNDAEVQDLLGRAYAAAGQAGPAEQRFAAASTLAPNNTGVLGRLAAARMALGDAGGASLALQRSVDLAPDQPGTSESLVATEIAAGNTEAATAALARLRERTGETETTGNLQGMLDVAKGNPDAAVSQFAATAAKFPDSVSARINQARLLSVLGRNAEAEPLFAEVLARQPANLQALGPLASRYVQAGHADQAASLMQRAITAQPDNPLLKAALSDLLVSAGKPKDAIKATEDAAHGTDVPVTILAARARALGADGQTGPAHAAYDQILRANPADGEARRQLIELLYAAGDYNGAEAAVRDGLKLAPGNPALLDTLVRIEFKANGVEGASRLADQLRADPANGPATATLKGDVMALAGRPAEALAAYNAAYAQSPSSALAMRIANLQAAQNRTDDAAMALRTWLKTHPDDVDATRLLAQFDLAANRLADAQSGFQAVLNSQPRDVMSLNNLAWIYQQQNDNRAKPTALAAYTQQPNADTADTLGWIDVTGGDVAAGLPLIRQSDALRPNTPVVRYHLGAALNAAGQKAEAVAVLDPLVNGSASFPEKADAKKLLDSLRSK